MQSVSHDRHRSLLFLLRHCTAGGRSYECLARLWTLALVVVLFRMRPLLDSILFLLLPPPCLRGISYLHSSTHYLYRHNRSQIKIPRQIERRTTKPARKQWWTVAVIFFFFNQIWITNSFVTFFFFSLLWLGCPVGPCGLAWPSNGSRIVLVVYLLAAERTAICRLRRCWWASMTA